MNREEPNIDDLISQQFEEYVKENTDPIVIKRHKDMRLNIAVRLAASSQSLPVCEQFNQTDESACAHFIKWAERLMRVNEAMPVNIEYQKTK